MMKNKFSLLPALTATAIVLAVGGGLVRLGIKQRIAAQNAEAVQNATDAAHSVERKLDRISAAVETLTAHLARRGIGNADEAADFGEIEMAGTEDVNFFFHPLGRTNQKGFAFSEGAPYTESDLKQWTDSFPSGASVSPRIEWLEPIRAANGEWVLAARKPLLLNDPTQTDDVAGWMVATITMDDLIRSSDVGQLSASGFDYQIELIAPNGDASRILARSTEFDLKTPVRQAIHSTQDRWFLLVVPKDGWIPWSLVLSQCVLVGVLALFGAVWASDAAHRPDYFQAEIEDRDRRLRALTQRLSDEIDRREELEKQFSHATSHDAFTGLPNRSYLMDRLARTLQRARLQPGYILAVIVLHLERFHGISETMGAAAGDELMMQAVKRFESCLRPGDLVVARLADDEIGMLLFDIGSTEAASSAATRLQESLGEAFEIKGQRVFAKASMGIALGSSGYEDAEELVRGAHMALSKAEDEGLAHYAVLDPATREQIVTQRQMETDLYQAVERREFRLNFQPIVSLETGAISGMEVLIRWHHPLEGLVPPSQFIPLAERIGLIVPITRWVLREACLQARAWRQEFPEDLEFYLSVNFSAQDLRQPDACEYVAEILRETELPAKVLRLEVTEGSMIGNLNSVSELVARFHGMGVSLLLDDFGTGYSSLSYLNRIRFDYIKIDQAFVSRISSEAQSNGIVRAIVHLSEDMGSQTIAEGVETAQIFEQLKKLGCNYGQGYYFSKPLESEKARQLLMSRPQWGASGGPEPLGYSVRSKPKRGFVSQKRSSENT